MARKKELETTTAIVKRILIKYPIARNSDAYLYIRVMETLNKGSSKLPYSDVVKNLEDLGLPCWDSVTRIRRKLQKEYPELEATETTRKHRKENEEDFKEYAKS